MNIFNTSAVHEALVELLDIEGVCKADGYGFGMDEEFRKRAISAVRDVIKICIENGFFETLGIARRSHGGISDTIECSEFQAVNAHVSHVSQALISELSDRRFLAVHPSCGEYIDNEVLFGPPVLMAFPSATEDITGAGNCLAAECNTAAVFHLMRAAEVALRALAKDRNIEFADKPLELKEWGQILSNLDSGLAALRADNTKHWPTPDQKEVQIRFYYEAVQELRGFNEAWRRHVSHARQEGNYDHDYAMSVMKHVEAFMQKLATKISEYTTTPKYWGSDEQIH